MTSIFHTVDTIEEIFNSEEAIICMRNELIPVHAQFKLVVFCKCTTFLETKCSSTAVLMTL